MFGDWFGFKRQEWGRFKQERDAKAMFHQRMMTLDYKFKHLFICPKCCFHNRKSLNSGCDAPWWLACDEHGHQSKCD